MNEQVKNILVEQLKSISTVANPEKCTPDELLDYCRAMCVLSKEIRKLWAIT